MKNTPEKPYRPRLNRRLSAKLRSEMVLLSRADTESPLAEYLSLLAFSDLLFQSATAPFHRQRQKASEQAERYRAAIGEMDPAGNLGSRIEKIRAAFRETMNQVPASGRTRRPLMRLFDL